MSQGKASSPEAEKLRKIRIGLAHKGRTKSPEHLQKILASRRNYSGASNPNYRSAAKIGKCLTCGDETRTYDKRATSGAGKFCSLPCKGDYMKTQTGSKAHRYIDGRCEYGNRHFNTGAHNKRWRLAVLERDRYTCTECGERGRELHVDHIKPFKDYPELRYELTNGRVLCKWCHYEITFRKSPLNNWEAYSRWAMVTRGKPTERLLQPQRLSEETGSVSLKR